MACISASPTLLPPPSTPCDPTCDGVDARVLRDDGAQVGGKVEEGAWHGLRQRQPRVKLVGGHPAVGGVGADLQGRIQVERPLVCVLVVPPGKQPARAARGCRERAGQRRRQPRRHKTLHACLAARTSTCAALTSHCRSTTSLYSMGSTTCREEQDGWQVKAQSGVAAHSGRGGCTRSSRPGRPAHLAANKPPTGSSSGSSSVPKQQQQQQQQQQQPTWPPPKMMDPER